MAPESFELASSGTEVIQQASLVVRELWHRWDFDVFQDGDGPLHPDMFLFAAAPVDEWVILLTTFCLLVLLECSVIRKYYGNQRNNLRIMGFWMVVGLMYNAYFTARYGRLAGVDWCAGYCLEWMLAIDNLFVFHLIFKAYRMPPELIHQALFLGILGAVGLRILIFFALGTLLQAIHWVRIAFGLVLLYSGLQAVLQEESTSDNLEDAFGVKVLRTLLGNRISEEYDLEGRLVLQREDGTHYFTFIVYVVLCLEVTDVVFAVDSVSAKVAQIPNQYIAYSSSVMSIFGLRAMFYVLKELVESIELLRYGLCMILVFVGIELIASPYVHLDSATVCIVILSVFLISITASSAKRLIVRVGAR